MMMAITNDDKITGFNLTLLNTVTDIKLNDNFLFFIITSFVILPKEWGKQNHQRFEKKLTNKMIV